MALLGACVSRLASPARSQGMLLWQAPAPSPVSQPQAAALHPTSAPAGSYAAAESPSRPSQRGSSISSRSSGDPPLN